jgi:hypothetical protein
MEMRAEHVSYRVARKAARFEVLEKRRVQFIPSRKIAALVIAETRIDDHPESL